MGVRCRLTSYTGSRGEAGKGREEDSGGSLHGDFCSECVSMCRPVK